MIIMKRIRHEGNISVHVCEIKTSVASTLLNEGVAGVWNRHM